MSVPTRAAVLGLGLMLCASLPLVAQAQDATTPDVATVPATEPAAAPVTGPADQASGPTFAAATSGIRVHPATEAVSAQDAADRAAHSGGLGTGGALMIVGGVALLAGLIIGGGAGTAVAVGGVVVGAYGLYVYLR